MHKWVIIRIEILLPLVGIKERQRITMRNYVIGGINKRYKFAGCDSILKWRT